MNRTSLFDPGLQTERTLLAWRRTCLALGLASAVAVRLLAPEFGGAAVGLGLAGAFVAAIAYMLAAHHYARTHRALVEGAVLVSGGRSLILLFGLVLFLDAVGLVYIVSRHA